MKASRAMKWFFVVVVLLVSLEGSRSWDDGSVLLRDIQALTLFKGRYTTARRSSPVPQLHCVGGSAGCQAFVPEVVQCQNKGWDGVDVQWECRTDMDNAYRFGHIEVSCEGYSSPNDAYILKGSCGLEYTLELTDEGKRRTQGGSWSWRSAFNGFGGNQHHQQQHQSSNPSAGETSGSMMVVIVLLLLAYGVYKMFLSGNMAQWGQDGRQNDHPRDNQYGAGAEPPPPGFKPDFTGHYSGQPHANQSHGYNSGYNYGQQYPGRQQPQGMGGGFWTGLGAGGLLGHLFGRQSNQPHNYNNSYYSANKPPPARDASSSTGTRTASGFGTTKRR
ncbi:store-operated calcium entry-associated regulatory factor [Genypterus blacodes]|uniref:store-operated calcium entry-associated regulatory factor n=1 Tax=Genypterus blacodes TaxID=154954 RepID=UPI003F76306C